MSNDYRPTLFLPQTDFPMKGNLPNREPDMLARWENMDMYRRLRKDAEGREKFILHDGPPYANGDLHMGHAMNKILKDVIVRSQQMTGKDAPYVPGWDCHGLPIEWKIEEKYRKKKMNKDDVPASEFRQECRDFAAHWIDIQRAQFKRLGIAGDWDNPYTTMAFDAEAQIVRELLKFAADGSLYRGSKPVMWSPVEKTALAEAEVEYHDHKSTQVDVAFDVVSTNCDAIKGAEIVIWTTTPWTIPGNRAICYGDKIDYVVIDGEGRKLVVAEALVEEFIERAGIENHSVIAKLEGVALKGTICAHPWRGQGYDFDVPLLAGDHVTLEAGTGFVHTAPGHGDDDYKVGHVQNAIEVPHTVDEGGCYYDHVPLVAGQHVYKVADTICQLLGDKLISRGELLHSYPHSWRSKAPLIFRNTAQWFISMSTTGLRDTAMREIDNVRWLPAQSKNRIRAMVEDRPDWIISRQRAWGVPITIFVNKESGEILKDEAVNQRIVAAVEEGGADAWFARDAQYFLGGDFAADDYEQVTDILDVWFDSGSTHAFVVEARKDLGEKASLYLEGSDQHRGWFQSSLLESCATRGYAPYKAVLTHGFLQDGQGYKMSKSKGNVDAPEKITQQYGADILRLWVVSTDYYDDVRFGTQIIQGQVDAYRKIRNTLRYLLSNLAGFDASERLSYDKMPELEQWVLHRLYRLDQLVRQKVADFDFNPIYQALYNFCIVDLSSFYFDIRKDSLYCDAKADERRRAARTVLDIIFHHLTTWLAPILVFTAEEVWQSRYPDKNDSVHLKQFSEVDGAWKNDALAEKWSKIRAVRRVVTGALEIERREKRIGSSLQARPTIYVDSSELQRSIEREDMAEISITSSVSIVAAEAPAGAFRLDDVEGVAVTSGLAAGEKCQRCWMILEEVGDSPDDLCKRCTDAVAASGVKPGVKAE
jgi:isoleucyl-tRNA synthetase